MTSESSNSAHVLTFNLEDYFQVAAFNRYVRQGHWDRFEPRLEHHTHRTLALLDDFGVKATFFVLGWVAEHHPHLVREISERGHEIASRGYWHQNIRRLTPSEFRADVARAKTVLERCCGRRVVGYRAADGWFGPDDLWALSVLAEEGYLYDSSVAPIGWRFRRQPFRRQCHTHTTPQGMIWELPISSLGCLGFSLPIGGGNWVRQLPAVFMRWAARRVARGPRAPLVMYFHTWELDDMQPRLTTAGWLTRLRHYRNLDCMEERVSRYLRHFTFVPAADWLGVPRPIVIPPPQLVETPPPAPVDTLHAINFRHRTPVTIVVPLFNEAETLGYLANTLERVRSAFAKDYAVQFILVDDGSTDDTHARARRLFAIADDLRILRHSENRGVAAAILTGIQAAKTEIVCSIDADCSYDPLELLQMIPKLTDGVAMVTASPYHPEGRVRNVPAWRLTLSKGASGLYRRLMRNKLHTYTSCFRVYRRSAVQNTPVHRGNFLGVVELLGNLDQRGCRIIEHPAVLDVRVLGQSKMKTLRTIAGHLRLMSWLLLARLKARFKLRSRSEPTAEDNTEWHRPAAGHTDSPACTDRSSRQPMNPTAVNPTTGA